jgi:DNA mismatch repair protein MutS2
MNRHGLRVLQFHAVLDAVAGRASSGLGAGAVRALEPTDDRAWIESELERVDAAMSLLGRTDGWALPVIPDLGAELIRLAKPGSVWEARTLLDGAGLIRSSAMTRGTLSRHMEALPSLAGIVDRLIQLDDRAVAIDRAIDDSAEVRDQASPALARIRQELRGLRSTIVQRLERFIASLPDAVRVADASVTVREGRYVVPVRREGRAQVGGIVHDESATGGTLFIEPPVALDLMNRVRELELADAREVQRILAELTGSLRPHARGLRASLDALVELDSLLARARYAREHAAVPPLLAGGVADFAIIAGRHPLLLEGDQPVVPFDLRLDPGERTLVVSGPNTGGKTVLLKAIGLISLMAQAGLVPPIAKGSRLPVFRDIFADIGDEQSIEASLSTFSAHLANLREIVAEADGASLVLIDEIGSGTDPSEGAALARAILVELTRRETLTVATSHLGQLKLLAGEEPGVVNASLQFDATALAPTYRLLKGIPGRSYGLAIARRLGFPAAVLERAEALLPTGERDVSQLLTELEEKEQELADALASAGRERDAAGVARADADRLRRELEERGREIRRREADMERRSRQQARDLLLNARREVEEAIAELRRLVEAGADRAQFDDAARAARRRVEEEASRQAERAPDPDDAVGAAAGNDAGLGAGLKLEPGVPVRIAATGARGVVIEVREGRATIDANGLRLDVRVADLEPLDADAGPTRGETAGRRGGGPARGARAGGGAGRGPADRASTGGGGWSGPSLEASPEVHLLGLRAEEVATQLHPALDAAVHAGLPSLRIVHGKGRGVLREVVTELLDRDPRVLSHRPGRLGEGGGGVTVALLS